MVRTDEGGSSDHNHVDKHLSCNHGNKYRTTCHIPANTRHSPNVGSMLAQRRRRWASIEATLVQCFVFAGILDQQFLTNDTGDMQSKLLSL